MSTAQIFLSSVSAEFRSYRDALRHDLDRHNVTVKVQEDFIATGTETLDKLDGYIRQCDVVIHLVGDMTGDLAQAPSVAVIRQRYPDFDKRLPPLGPFLQLEGPALSYTQWEAWLALYHGKTLIIAVPQESAPRDERYLVDEEQRAAQQAHLARLASVERYPEIWFANKDRLAVDILRSHLQEILTAVKKLPDVERRDTIPHARSSFIGREREQTELREKIFNYSLVTVAGAPGVGKTRLTIQAARLLEPDFDAIWFVPLSQLPQLGAIPLRIAHVLQIKGQYGKELVDLIGESLKRGRQLLILDNCEAVLGECAAVVNKLRALCGELHLVLTSRIDLGTAIEIGAEYVYRVPPLELPDPDRLPDLKALADIDSVKLLLERVQARSDTFRLTKANAKKIAQLCRRLDGIPLAVELVAAQMDILSLDSVLEQWSKRLDFSRGDVAQLDQQATLRNTIYISYDLLGREQNGERLRTLFKRLSIFRRGWTIEAALMVCGEPNETREGIQELMKPLRRASLVEAEEVAGENRLRYLDAIREFAFAELAKEGRDKELAALHARWATELAERWQPRLLTGEQAVALAKLIAEADNFRAAILWAHEWQDAEIALRVTSALWRLMEIKGFYRDGESRLRMALGVPGAKNFPLLRSKALSGLSILAFRQGDLETSKRCSLQSLALERKYGGNDHAGMANALNDLGNVAQLRGEYQKALDLYTESLKIEQTRGDERCIAVCLFNTGRQFMNVEKLGKAEATVRASLKIFDKTGNRREAAFALNTLALIERYRGQYEAASRYADRSLEIRQNLGDPHGIVQTMLTKADILIGKHDFDAALNLLEKSGDTSFLINDERGVAETLEQLASLASDQDLHAKAVVLYAAADEIRKKLRLPLPPVAQHAQDARIEGVRNALGDTGFAAQWEKGRWTPPQEAFALGVSRKSNLCGGSDE